MSSSSAGLSTSANPGVCGPNTMPASMKSGIVGRPTIADLPRSDLGPLGGLCGALAYADAATTILLHLQSTESGGSAGLGSIPLIEDHAEVHQATGMITVQAGITLAQALVLLQGRAFADNRPIGGVAQDVLSGLLHFGIDGQNRPRED